MDPVRVADISPESDVVTVREQHSAAAPPVAAHDGVAVVGTTFAGQVTVWTAKAQSMFGWAAEEALSACDYRNWR